MPATDVSCLYSTVRNESGYTRTFGFLPPHGRKLTPNEEFTVFGDIRQALIRGERTEARRNILAFEAAISRGDITIIATPNVILEDDANPGAPSQMLRLHNGVVGVTDVCWSGESSLSQPAVS